MASPDPIAQERAHYVSLLGLPSDDLSLTLAELRALTGAGVDARAAAEAKNTERRIDNVASDVSKLKKSASVSVTSYGAIGDGVNDDTVAIQTAIEAGKGGQIYFPSGTYKVDAQANTVPSGKAGIVMDDPGTTLVLAPNAQIFISDTGAYASAQIVHVSADNCSIVGGRFTGDVETHTGTTGEWSHGISVWGCTNFRATGVTVEKCWGDGFYIGGAPAPKATFIDCVARKNRRQGLSVISGDVKIIGGDYIETGTIKGTSPMAGINLEPNANNVPPDTVRATIMGANMSGNVGAGLLVAQAIGATAITGNAVGNTMTGNDKGFYAFQTVGSPNPDFRMSGNKIYGNTTKNVDLNSVLGIKAEIPWTDYVPILQATTSGNLTNWVNTGRYKVDSDGYVIFEFECIASATFDPGNGIYRTFLPIPAHADESIYRPIGDAIAAAYPSNYFTPVSIFRTSSTYNYFMQPNGMTLDNAGPTSNGVVRAWTPGGFIKGTIRYKAA